MKIAFRIPRSIYSTAAVPTKTSRTACRALLAIDPAPGGGIAWLDQAHGIMAAPLPATDGGIVASLREVVSGAKRARRLTAFISYASGYRLCSKSRPKVFLLGERFGFLKAAVLALKVKLVVVHPVIWQRPLGAVNYLNTWPETEWNNFLVNEARRRLPKLEVTSATATALLLLDWTIRGRGELSA